MQWKDVTDYFVQHDLLPSNALEVNDYEELEKKLIRHVFGPGDKSKNVVIFDSEYIDSANAYSDLFNKFISVMSNNTGIELINSQVDLDNQSATISSKKHGKVYEGQWAQNGDWVSGEFLQYVLDVTSNEDEVFHSFNPGDQTIVYTCINKKIGEFLNQSKDDIENSGKVYFKQQFENKSADDFDYLPRSEYFDILNEFKSSFMSSDSFEISSFKVDSVDILCGLFIPKFVAKNLAEARTKYASPDLSLYTKESAWDLDTIVPDSNVYVFSIDEKLAVLFEANAKAAMNLLGRWASDNPRPDLIFLAEDFSWAIYSSPFEDFKDHLIFIGFSRKAIEQDELVFNAEDQ